MNIKEIEIKFQKEITFSNSIGDFSISSNKNIYNAIRIKYLHLAETVTDLFLENWKAYTDYNMMFSNINEDFIKFISPVIEEVKNDLFSLEIYDKDDESIIKYAEKEGIFDTYISAYNSFTDSVSVILSELEGKKNQRQLQMESRSRWQGSRLSSDEGFIESYKNDLKYQIGIEARNAIEGVGYSLANSVVNMISESNASKKLESLFKKDSTMMEFVNGFYKSAWAMHLLLIRLIEKEEVWFPAGQSDMEKCERLVNNFISDSLGENERKSMILSAFDLNPYSDTLYANLLIIYPDESKNITEIAEYFGVSLKNVKNKLASEYLNTIIGTTEDEAIAAKDKLMIYCQKIGLPFDENLPSYQKLTKQIHDFDINYRTVDSVICQTREGADLARSELNSIQEFIEKIIPPTKDSLLDYEQTLLCKKAEFDRTYKSELKDKYLQIIQKYLDDFNNYFLSVGLFKASDRKEAGMQRAIKYAKKLDVSSEKSVKQSKQKLLDYLPLVGLTEKEALEAFNIIDRNRDKFLNPNVSQKVFEKLTGFWKK